MADFMNNFYNSMMQDIKNKQQEVSVQAANNPMFNNTMMFKTISDIPSMTEAEREKFIELYFYKILSLISDRSNINYLSIWISAEFLDSFSKILTRIVDAAKYRYINMNTTNITLTQANIIQVNNLMYSILTMPDTAKPNNYNDIVAKVYNISSTINSIYVPHIESLGIPRHIAEYIALTRFSSFSLESVIKRLDFLLVNQPKEIMTEEVLTNILKYLFQSDQDWQLFLQIFMFDVLKEDEYWVTQDVEEVDSILNLAVLNALQSRGPITTYISIRDYSMFYAMTNKPIRFSFKTLSSDYQMINNIVYQIELDSNGGYYVP